MKHAAHVLHWWEWNLKVCRSCLLWRRLNWAATNCNSSASRAKASTSFIVFTVRVENGRLSPDLGSSAQVKSSSPQKSPSFSKPRLKNPLLPPSVVTLSSRPCIIKSILTTGYPSRTMYAFSVNKHGFSRSQMASSKLSSIFSNKGTYKTPAKQSFTSTRQEQWKKKLGQSNITEKNNLNNWKVTTRSIMIFHRKHVPATTQKFWHSVSASHKIWSLIQLMIDTTQPITTQLSQINRQSLGLCIN